MEKMPKILRIFILHVVALLCSVPAVASADGGERVESDSIVPEVNLRYSSITATGAGVAFTAAGAIARAAGPNSISSGVVNHSSDGVTDYLRFAPVALPWVMKLAGQPTRSGWGRMAVSNAMSGIVTIGVVSGLKKIVAAGRPDGSDLNSFPSGHAAIAFMGATIMARELGWRSPWYTIGAYGFATGVSMERVISDHHFPADVVAGAGIGILATELGYFVTDLIFRERGIEHSSKRWCAVEDNGNFSNLSVSSGLRLPFGRVRTGDVVITSQPALYAALRGGVAVGNRWGVTIEGGMTSTPLLTGKGDYRTYIKSLSSIGVMLLPYYKLVISSRLSIMAEAGGGYMFNLPLHAADKALTTGRTAPAGRVSIGAGLRLSDHFSAGANVGYEISRYDYRIAPSTTFRFTRPLSAKGVTNLLLLSISSCYEF